MLDSKHSRLFLGIYGRYVSFIGQFRDDTDRRHGVSIVVISSIEIAMAVFYSVAHFFWGSRSLAVIIVVLGIVTLCNMLYFLRSLNIRFSRHVPIVSAYFCVAALVSKQGGLDAPALAWFVLVPMLTVFMSSIAEAFVWAFIATVSVLIFYLAGLHGYVQPAVPVLENRLFHLFMATNGLIFFCLLFGVANEVLKRHAYVEIYRLANEDMLTGIPNRRRFFQLAQDLFENESVLFAVLFDIDRFKAINDQYGHPAGDKVLCAFADCIMARLRPGSVLGRIGGEEFALLIAGGDEAAVMDEVEQLRMAVEELLVDTDGWRIRFSTSCGVARKNAKHDRPDNLDSMLARADDALFDAKKAGRNRVASRF